MFFDNLLEAGVCGEELGSLEPCFLDEVGGRELGWCLRVVGCL